MIRKSRLSSASRAGVKENDTTGMGRSNALLFFVFLIGVVAIARLAVVQIFGYERWAALAENQQSVSAEILPDRGEIFFREGNTTYPAAVNREYPLLYVVPRDVDDVPGTAAALSGITGIAIEEILLKFVDTNDPFEVVKKKISEEEANRIRELKRKGVHLLTEKYRYYPAGMLAAQTVGFVSAKDGGNGQVGKYGLEASLDPQLRGKPGKVTQARDAAGRWISTSDREFDPSEKGPNVILTIDRVIQHEVERILREAVEKHRADSGSIVVMEAKTGKILALASEPTFDPNEYSKIEDFGRFLNPVVSQAYEPGSIMKPLTMAIGIEEGKVSADTEFTDPCAVAEAGYTIRNAEGKCYGRSSMRKVLEESINTGMIFVEKLIGNQRFGEYLNRFGFGQKTDIELPAEVAGNLKNLSDTRRDIQFFTASFGQGVTATPIQLIAAYGALANNGILLKPRIVDRYVYEDGREEMVSGGEERRIVSEDTARVMGEMLEGVVLRGHGKRAAVPGYRVGGKTGTAQVAKQEERGYEDGLTIGSFVGYAPVGDPRFVVLSKIDNPKDVIWAESSAAPVFGEVMKFLLAYGKVEPTEEIKNPEPIPVPEGAPTKEETESDTQKEKKKDRDDKR